MEKAKLFDEIDLSKLKVLKLRFVSEKVIDKLLSRCNSLETFDLRSISEGDLQDVTNFDYQPSIPSLQEFLRRNQTLKKIKLTGFGTHKLFFKEDISEIVTFQLTYFYIEERAPFQRTEQNSMKFLATQSKSLEHLYIVEDRLNVIEFICNEMPRLKHLSFLADNKLEDLKLRVNDNVVSLSLPLIWDHESFLKVICYFPNLTKLAVRVLTSEAIAVISNQLPALRTLLFSDCTGTVDGPAWKTLFPNATPKHSVSKYGRLWSIEK